MMEQRDMAPTQEPGIGGPVDLAGIARYRGVRMVLIFLLLAVSGAVVISAAEGGLDWPEDFPLRDGVPLIKLALNVNMWAMLALVVPAGNRTENWLVCLLALPSMGLGILGTFGCAAIFFVWELTPLWGVHFVAPMLGGYAAVLPLVLPPAFLAFRRHNRLVRATREAET